MESGSASGPGPDSASASGPGPAGSPASGLVDDPAPGPAGSLVGGPAGSPGLGLPPRIGLTTYVEDARWGVWDRPAVVLPHSYIAAVIAAGGLPVLLPPGPSGAAAARSAIGGIDALILTGGADVSPSGYGASPHPETAGTQPTRDSWEIALFAAAIDADLPVLAICRGVQVVNVARGGTLHQHLPDVVGHDGHRPEPAVLGTTEVRLTAGTPVSAILGTELKVPCYHHQAIDRLGEGVDAVGWADDGTVEAIVVPDAGSFVLGVQWHPEDGDDPRLFDALVTAATEPAPEGGGRRPHSGAGTTVGREPGGAGSP